MVNTRPIPEAFRAANASNRAPITSYARGNVANFGVKAPVYSGPAHKIG